MEVRLYGATFSRTKSVQCVFRRMLSHVILSNCSYWARGPAPESRRGIPIMVRTHGHFTWFWSRLHTIAALRSRQTDLNASCAARGSASCVGAGKLKQQMVKQRWDDGYNSW